MAADPLEVIWWKLGRAQQQIDEFEGSVKDFLARQTQAYDFTFESQMDCWQWREYPLDAIKRMGLDKGARQILPGRWFLQSIDSQKYIATLHSFVDIPAIEWGIRVGEIVHHLRSALDHIAWTLTLRHQWPTRPPKRLHGKWSRVQFPVSETLIARGPQDHRRAWNVEVARCLWGVDPELMTLFEDAQPHRLKRSYKRHLLWILNELWNLDKHRAIAVAVGYGAAHDIQVVPPDNDPASARALADYTFETLSKHAYGPLQKHTEFAQVLVSHRYPERLRPGINVVPMKVHSELMFYPTFDKRGPAPAQRMMVVLPQLWQFVVTVVRTFEVHAF